MLGAKVFSKPNKVEAEGWRDSLYRVYKSGQQSMRVAVYGCKHDATLFEVMPRYASATSQPVLSSIHLLAFRLQLV